MSAKLAGIRRYTALFGADIHKSLSEQDRFKPKTTVGPSWDQAISSTYNQVNRMLDRRRLLSTPFPYSVFYLSSKSSLIRAKSLGILRCLSHCLTHFQSYSGTVSFILCATAYCLAAPSERNISHFLAYFIMFLAKSGALPGRLPCVPWRQEKQNFSASFYCSRDSR